MRPVCDPALGRSRVRHLLNMTYLPRSPTALPRSIVSTARPRHDPVAHGHQCLRRERLAAELDLLDRGSPALRLMLQIRAQIHPSDRVARLLIGGPNDEPHGARLLTPVFGVAIVL